jgi:flagellar assembly protein FliH
MSSSNIFKQDPDFKPTALVQEEIPVSEEINPPVHDSVQVFDTNEPTDEEAAPQENDLSPAHEDTVVDEQVHATPEQADIDIQAIQEEAYKSGFEEASQQYEQQLQTVLETFKTSCQKIDSLHGSLLEKYRGDIINTAITLAEKIIASELSTKRNIIAATLEKALDIAIKSDEFIVTINPDDLETVEKIKEQLISHINGLEHVVLKTSNDVAPGGCLLESTSCSVDATIPAQLESARDFLEENTLPLVDETAENQNNSQ